MKTRNDIVAKSIASSICAVTGTRIDTLQLRYPRIIHADFMTHRVFSRNASSSRAIPTASLLVRDADPFVPLFRKNKPGMQPGDDLTPEEQAEAARIWLDMARYVAEGSKKLADKSGLNVAKQWSNRPLEWFGYIDVVVTSTDYANFTYLRDHPVAQDEIQLLAQEMLNVRNSVTPRILQPGEWHLPYIDEDDEITAYGCRNVFTHTLERIFGETELCTLAPQDMLLLLISAARCCRVSYSKHDGTASTIADDIGRFLRLVPENDPVHASPLEHQATPLGDYAEKFRGNLRNFAQFRKFVPNEALSE